METNKYTKAWIWIWYNDITRLCILFGCPVLPAISMCYLVFGSGEYLKTVVIIVYAFFIGWAMVDNDYSHLRRIGLDEYRNKL